MKKTITLEENNWNELIRLKYEYKHKTINETISFLLYELNNERESS